ncbi:hypothetical protein ACJX0J_015459, partial [Zea mays]
NPIYTIPLRLRFYNAYVFFVASFARDNKIHEATRTILLNDLDMDCIIDANFVFYTVLSGVTTMWLAMSRNTTCLCCRFYEGGIVLSLLLYASEMIMVRAMKWLDDIIPDAPYAITVQFLLLFWFQFWTKPSVLMIFSMCFTSGAAANIPHSRRSSPNARRFFEKN